MVYVVARYYIGDWSRYDASEGTDRAELNLFSDYEKAIEFVRMYIGNDNFDFPKSGIYNHDGIYMLTLEEKVID